MRRSLHGLTPVPHPPKMSLAAARPDTACETGNAGRSAHPGGVMRGSSAGNSPGPVTLLITGTILQPSHWWRLVQMDVPPELHCIAGCLTEPNLPPAHHHILAKTQ